MSAYDTLRAANVARQAAWCPNQKPDLSFRGNELAGETGEVCNVIKKIERERQGWRGSRDTVEHLAEELADVVICADLVALAAGIDLDAAVEAKFNATSEKVGLPHRYQRTAALFERRLAGLVQTGPGTWVSASSPAGKAGAFSVGDHVEKTTGDYAFPGTIIGVLRKLSGQVRYAVEDDRGAIHIFNAGQLRFRLSTMTADTGDN